MSAVTTIAFLIYIFLEIMAIRGREKSNSMRITLQDFYLTAKRYKIDICYVVHRTISLYAVM